MTAEDLAICVPNPPSQNSPFFKLAWDLLQTQKGQDLNGNQSILSWSWVPSAYNL